MGKTPLSTNKNSTNGQTKNKSNSSIIKTSSDSIQRRQKPCDNSTRRVPMTTSGDKENIGSQTKSSSDISDDEQMECESITQVQPNRRKVSAVHEFATKLTPREYECKLCSKVNIQFHWKTLHMTNTMLQRQTCFK